MKWKDFLSERMVFGLIIISGYIGAMIILSYKVIPPENSNLLSQGMGALGTAVGVIVTAIWKADKVDRQTAETAATLAAKAPDLSSSPLRTEVTNSPANPVPTTEGAPNG